MDEELVIVHLLSGFMDLRSALLCVKLLKVLLISIHPHQNSTKTYVQVLKHVITKTWKLFAMAQDPLAFHVCR